MNLKKKLSSLHFQTVGPSLLVLIIFLLSFSFAAWVVSNRFKKLQDEISINTNATRSLLEISRIRGNSKETLLLYRLTKETKYLGQLNDIEMEKALQFNRLRSELQEIGPNEILVDSFFSGSDEMRELRNSVLEAIASKENNKATKLFNDFTKLFNINSARLEDLHALVHSRITNAEQSMRLLLEKIPAFLAFLLALGFVTAWAMAVFYKRRVLMPLKNLQRGLGAVSAGQLGESLAIPNAATEIQSMLKDFNHMTAQLKKVTIDLNHAHERAVQAAKIKTDFLANMSHEIRTPLNVIVGLSDILSERDWPSEAVKEVQLINKSSAMLLGIVNDILDYSRLESGKVTVAHEMFDLKDRILNVGTVVEQLAQAKNLKFAVNIHASVPQFIIGDCQLLEQVLINLANNAVKFTAKGSVTIGARCDFGDSVPYLVITVVDSGIGIKAENLEKLFTRFTQADSSITRSHGGTGLGLAIVKQIASCFKGDVTATSVFGIGSTFTFRIPIQLPTEQQLASAPVLEKSSKKEIKVDRHLNILLVDDSVDNRFLVKNYLKGLDVTIVEAENGREALSSFRLENFDIILMDIQMPEVDGYQATREIRRLEKEQSRERTPVIALTAFAFKEEIERTLDSGCDSHMAKPIRKTLLLQTIEKFLI